MNIRNVDDILTLVGLCLCIVLISADSDSSCPGPRQHYKEIGCTPVFNHSDYKCPMRYNCDHLKDIPADKCFINGHVYEHGDSLRDEDRNSCHLECFCSHGIRGLKFDCSTVYCPSGPPTPGCYKKRNALNCCSGPEICLKDPEDRPNCLVDGKTYRDGEYFQPEAEPWMQCYCGPGYTGQNVEPYCISPKIGRCGTILHNIDDVRGNCAPVYYFDQSPQMSCSFLSRCQSDKDVVIPSTHEHSKTVDPNMVCKLGALTMRVGDKLNEGTDYDSECVKCVCEVPPIPTCRRLSEEECKIEENSFI